MLSRSHRFHGLGSLNLTYRQGQTVRGRLLSLKFAQNPRRKTYRVAVVVSRKVNKSAVVRNRIRRRVYEAFRPNAANINGPYDLVFTAFSDEIAGVDFVELSGQVADLLKKSGVLIDASKGHAIVSTEGKRD
jgi:ribonuclease P protein component